MDRRPACRVVRPTAADPTPRGTSGAGCPGSTSRARADRRCGSRCRTARVQPVERPPRRIQPGSSAPRRPRARRQHGQRRASRSRRRASARRVVGQSGDRLDVGEVDRAGGVQEDRAGDAAVPPLVLVLDVRRVRPLDDGQPERVRSRPQVRPSGRTRTARCGVLADADLHAVELDDQDALGRADVEHDPPAGPGRRQLEVALVDAGRVDARGSPAGGPANGIWTLV